MKIVVIIAALLGAMTLYAQEHYADDPLGHLEATETLKTANRPQARHSLGEKAANFAAAEPAIADRKICFVDKPNKRKKCSEVLQGGNGVVLFNSGGLLTHETPGLSLYRFYTQYKFESGILVEIALATGNTFSEVVDDFSARFGKPSKTWTETSQNANGAKFDLGNASWDLPDGARALVAESVLFIVPPIWANGKHDLPDGLVHTTNAVIMNAAALAKAPSNERHVSF